MRSFLLLVVAAIAGPSAALEPSPKVNTNVENSDQSIWALNMNDEIGFWYETDPKAACTELQVADRLRGPWRTIVAAQRRPDDHPVEVLVDQGFDEFDPSSGRDFRDESYCYRMLLFDVRARHYRTYPAVCVPASVEPGPSESTTIDPNEPVTDMVATPPEAPQPPKKKPPSCARLLQSRGATDLKPR